MRHFDMPVGSVITLGHPDNLRLAVKTLEGRWRLLHNGQYADPEEFRGTWDVFIPHFPAQVKVELARAFGFTPLLDYRSQDSRDDFYWLPSREIQEATRVAVEKGRIKLSATVR